ncbi:PKD domain-containing protein [Trujillonella endophytica]|uniref:PKD repeat-containing protein n=1 Tax=Trujillonella endophytica TaxID=673521 RepID=A0A1H8SJV6_9ACTN|nr:PKD domain-containing protein [Trujillella endophytica]SEO79289.1 PKD repeat-containing protein [Trujillella endophytica]
MSTSSSAPRRAPARVVAGTVGLLLTAGSLALLPGTAQADSAPLVPSASTPTTVTADALPTVQINGVAWAQAVVGNTVYVGGKFTSARPAGAPAGTNETPRANLLAYDIRTGELITSFAHALDGQVLAVAASPDGSRVYVAGDFTTVDGQSRRRVAAFDTATGALVAGFAPAVQSQVAALAVTNDTVYMGGSITAVGSVSRSRLAAVSAADGSLLPWAPVPGVGSATGNSDGNRNTSDAVLALTVSGTGQVVAGGRFDSMNGVKATGVTSLDPVSGATMPFAINQRLTNQGVNSAVYSLSTSGNLVIGTAYDYYGPGNLEGSFVVQADGGAIVEINDCRGDSYSNYATGGVVYVASHSHDCRNIGAFVEQNPRVHKFGVAFTLAPTGTVGSSTITNSNFRGQPAGSLLPWFPTMTPGTVTGQGQAGWSVTGNDRYVVYGGEFPRVNGIGQQGLVRYALPGTAPNAVGPSTDGFTATATSPAPGRVTVGWTATSDQDNANLVYRVQREGQPLPVAETVQASTWWNRPAMSAGDAGVSGSLRYRVTATDPFGNTVATPWVAVEVAVAPPVGQTRPYAESVRADGASNHWRLGETTGAAADAIGTAPMTVGAGVTRGQAGAVTGNTAYSFNGSSTASLATGTAQAAPNTFTQEAWVQTSSTTGGRIMGFANRATGTSTSYDRQVYLETNGRISFAVKVPTMFGLSSQTRAVTSTASFNDGAWHHVAATMSPAGISLYVDGVLVGSRTDATTGQSYSGYLRVGADRAIAGASTFTGRIDEVALYRTALTAQQIAAHATGGGVSAPTANQAPTARIAVTRTGLTAALDGRGSVDGDGSVAAYAWDFGDGQQGTGATASHTYAAAGTYVVGLTVTDDRGATTTAKTLVTVAPVRVNAAPRAAFTATGRDLGIAVDGAASDDADGTVTGHSWNWGDGSPAGTGVAAAHTYAAAGTYTVTLTVTDSDGATGTTTQQVTVTAPISTAPLAKDTFGRSVTGGLGAADVGGAWTVVAGAARQSVTGGVAELALPGTGNNTGSYLGGVSTTSADVRTSFTLTSVPTGSGTTVYVTGRRVGDGAEYRVQVRVAADGKVYLSLLRIVGGVQSFPGGEVTVPGLTWTPGMSLDTRVQVSGVGTTTITASAWAAGTAEPAAPQLTRTDTSASLQAAGSVGLAAYRPSSATAATAVRVTAFRVGLVGAAAHVNLAPTAAFTAQAENLAVAVDATGSADSDGRVVRAAWTFGDGEQADGTAASHTYAAAGTYTVTLTVTDDEGATATSTRRITVTAPPAPPVEEPAVQIAADAFDRASAGGLGTADLGGAWASMAGAARQAVADGGAVLTVNPGNNTGAHLSGVAAASADVRTTVSFSAVPATGTGVYAHVTGRRVGTALYYARVRVLPGGGVSAAIVREVAGVESVLGPVTTLAGVTYTPGTQLELRFRVSGSGTTDLALTVWQAGTAEPTTATLVRADGAAELQAPGSVGIAAYLSGSATGPVAVRFEGITVTAVR